MKKITAFSVIGLNGYVDIRVNLKGPHCILVGPNGTGKSTALQIVCYALGRRWRQLAALRFDEVRIEFGDTSYSLSRDSCRRLTEGSLGPARYNRLYETLLEADLIEVFHTADLSQPEGINKFRRLSSLPLSELRNAQRFSMMARSDKPALEAISKFQRVLEQCQVPKALYLPTSRRIEFDISKLTERLPEYVQKDFVSSMRVATETTNFEEVLKFGMEDIESLITGFEERVRNFSRNRFNKMMSFYLKEMANSQSISIRDVRSLGLDQERINTVLSRIEEGLLSIEEKSEIGNIVMSMARKQKGGHPPFHKLWLAHFFVRLLEVDSDIASLEAPIRALVDDLEKYLPPKTVSYDIESYHFSIVGSRGEELKLSDLSSGEKQLVSLLTILQLSPTRKMNIFIDEPELSLSVPWQAEFLPDIIKTPSCNQLFAVTHSPFIYENELGDSVIDFLECMSDR